MSEFKVGDIVQTSSGHFWTITKIKEHDKIAGKYTEYFLTMIMRDDGDRPRKISNRTCYYGLKKVTKSWVYQKQNEALDFWTKVWQIAMEDDQ